MPGAAPVEASPTQRSGSTTDYLTFSSQAMRYLAALLWSEQTFSVFPDGLRALLRVRHAADAALLRLRFRTLNDLHEALGFVRVIRVILCRLQLELAHDIAGRFAAGKRRSGKPCFGKVFAHAHIRHHVLGDCYIPLIFFGPGEVENRGQPRACLPHVLFDVVGRRRCCRQEDACCYEDGREPGQWKFHHGSFHEWLFRTRCSAGASVVCINKRRSIRRCRGTMLRRRQDAFVLRAP